MVTRNKANADVFVEIKVIRYTGIVPSANQLWGSATLAITKRNGDVVLSNTFTQGTGVYAASDDIASQPIKEAWKTLCNSN